MTPKSQTSRFLDRIGAFSMQGLGEVLPENKAHSPALGDTGFIAYYNNEGKRQAVRDLTAFILALDAPCLSACLQTKAWTGCMRTALLPGNWRGMLGKWCRKAVGFSVSGRPI